MHSLLLVSACMAIGCQAQTPSQTYSHSNQLDIAGNVFLYWNFNTSFITLELHGQTTGWIGVGFSPSGSMIGADMIVGWVKSGVTTITDRHATANTFPPMDSEQNIDVLSGGESNGWTWIKFTRQLAACETPQDVAITGNTLKVIYAYGASDPTGDDIVGDNYHGTNRGTKSVIFTESADANSVAPPSAETTETFTVRTGGVTIPTARTYYSCHLVAFPTVPSKRHIVKISPLVQSGNELYVHHIVIYQCVDPLPNGTTVGSEGECYTTNAPIHDSMCRHVIFAWANGGEEFAFPTDVGFPFGEAGDPKNVVIEMHYDNPNLTPGVVDNSGLTFHYTSQLRTHDAGVIQAGQAVNSFSHVIPPKATSFLTYGDCSGNCLQSAMTVAGVSSIKIFASIFHTHLLGRKVTLRQVRNGVEQPYITKDDSYDFDFQTSRYVSPERTILPGDSLQVLCDYDSSSKTTLTYGGLDTTREMCLAFILYYPKLPISVCVTTPIRNPGWYQAVGLTDAQIADLTFTGNFDITATLANFSFQSTGQTLEEYLNAFNWDQNLATEFSLKMNSRPKLQTCSNNIFVPPGVETFVLPLNITQPYNEPVQTCFVQTTTTSTTATTTSGKDSPKSTTGIFICTPLLFSLMWCQ